MRESAAQQLLESRLAAGHQFNAYELGNGSGWLVSIGPISDHFSLAYAPLPEIADHLVAALREKHGQPPCLAPATGRV